jgi:replicative DNA helicase
MDQAAKRSNAAPVKRADIQKKMPYDLEAERSILGAILLDDKAVYSARSVVTSDDFYLEAHRTIFEIMLQLALEQKPVDPILVRSRLEQKACLEKVGGVVYLASLTDGLPRGINVPHYAGVVKSRSTLRRMIQLSDELMTRAFSNEEEPEEIVARAQKELFAMLIGKGDGGFHDIAALVLDTYKELERIAEQKRAITGVPSGFPDLDRLTRGFQASDYYIIAARPSMGKTTLAMNIAANAAIRHKEHVCVFSLEMSKESLVKRMVAAEAEVDSYRMLTGHLTREDWGKISHASVLLGESPLSINDESSIDIGRMFAQAHMLNHKRRLGLIIVDYLQLMRSGTKYDNRTHEVSQVSAALKKLAKDLRVPVIALSQLSRAKEVQKREPQLSDLRESGSIEQDADAVLFIDAEEDEQGEKHSYEGLLKKQRNGPTGRFPLYFMKQCTKFSSCTAQEVN